MSPRFVPILLGLLVMLLLYSPTYFPPLSDVWVLVLNASRPPSFLLPPSPPPVVLLAISHRISSHISHHLHLFSSSPISVINHQSIQNSYINRSFIIINQTNHQSRKSSVNIIINQTDLQIDQTSIKLITNQTNHQST